MWTLLPPEPLTVRTPSGAQAEAVRPERGVTLVLGAAGTGKTAALVDLVVDRLGRGRGLSEVAVLAGSRRAAQGIRREVVARAGGAQVSPLVTTVHGLALGLLRRFQPVGEPFWTLLRAPQQEERIRELLASPRVAWPEALRPALGTRAFATQLRELLARIRQRSMDEAQLAALARQREDETLAAVADFLDEYLAVGDLEHTVDYAELVYRARILANDPDAADELRATLREVVVDDAHDLDAAQLGLLRDLARLGIPVTVFADPAQTVSGFRGADARALLGLLEVTPSRRVLLDEDPRHSTAVAAAVGSLRARIPGPMALPARPVSEVQGEVSVQVHPDAMSEALHIADQLRHAVAEGATWADLAVVMRAGRAQLVPMATTLLRLGIPVELAAEDLVLGEDPAVATLLQALRLAASGAADLDEDALARLLTSGLVAADEVALRKLGRVRGEGTLAEAVLAHPELAGERGSQLIRGLATARRALDSGAPVQDALWTLWTCTDWPDRLRAEALDGGRRAHLHLDALVELFDRAAREPLRTGVGGAHTFCREVEAEEIAMDTGRESTLSGTGVQLTTAHRAKGMEWRRVWIAGVQEGRWPRATPGALLLDPSRLLDEAPRTVGEHIAEERRLFHLACGKAATHLHVSAVEDGEQQVSRFVHELGVPVEHIVARPDRPLTATALVGELRATAADPECGEGRRRGAAQRLARMAERGLGAADPSRWWGLRRPEGPVPQRLALSGSGLEDILTCPRRYYLSRPAGAGQGRDRSTGIGDLLHLIAEGAQREGWDRERMHEELEARLDELEPAAPWSEEADRARSREMVDRLATWLEQQQGSVVGIEAPFRVDVSVGGRTVILHGRADRLEVTEVDGAPALRVADFKTVKTKRTAAQIDGDVQLGVYQLAASLGGFDELAPGIRTVAPPALVQLRHDKGGLPVVGEQSTLAAAPTLGEEAIEVGPTWLHDRIHRAAEVLEAGAFPATEGPACRYCDFRAGCPALRGDEEDQA